MTEQLQQIQRQLSEIANSIGQAAHEQQQHHHDGQDAPIAQGRRAREDILIQQIEKAYGELGATKRKHARAELAKRRHETRIRVDNADALMAAKNERTEKLYLEGLLDTDEYRKLQDQEKAAELEHFEARAEVDRLQLTVKLLRIPVVGADGSEEART